MLTIDGLSERKRTILDMLAQNGVISISEISKSLNVSAVTVRSDLSSLEDAGFIVRTRGGASTALHRSILERQRHKNEEKNKIARAAAELVGDGDTIMIEAGTTTALIGKYLLGRRDVHVVSNSALLLPFARSNPSLHLTLTGGEFRSFTESFVGPMALQVIEQFHVMIAFVGTDGFSIEEGLTTHLPEGAEIVRKMALQAERSVLVADSTKFGRAGFASVLPIDKIDRVVSDLELDPANARRIEEAGPEVELV